MGKGGLALYSEKLILAIVWRIDCRGVRRC